VVPFNPYLDTITPIRTIEGLAQPHGVAISNEGRVIVAEFAGHRVTVLDKEGKKIKSFSISYSGSIKFSCPRDIATTPDNFIIVVDNHKIQKITLDGKLIQCLGQKGNKPLEFNTPWGIASYPTTGQIYVLQILI
jgi:tripartite motif-containing protein 2/3/tripartite motif-containing protein 71